jgi:O-antigen ligase
MTLSLPFFEERKQHVVAAVLIGSYAATLAVVPSWRVAAALTAPLVMASLFWFALTGAERWIGLLLASAILLPPLPFALGDSGPHPALVFAGMGVLVGVARLREWRIAPDGITAPLLILTAVLLASVGLALATSGALAAAASFARVCLFGIGVYVYAYAAHGPCHALPATAVAARWLFIGAVIAATFACFDFYYQFPAPAGYGPQFLWLDTGIFRRAQGLFYEASTLGNFCAFFLVMVAAALFSPERYRILPRPALAAGATVLAAALVLSFSRGSLVNVAISMTALAWLRRVRLMRLAVILIASICGAALAVYTFFPTFATTYWIRLVASIEYFTTSPNGVLSGRVDSWRVLAGFLVEHPWRLLFGIGYKTLPYSDVAGKAVIADNMYLDLLVETGVVGVAALLLLNYAILRGGLRAARSGLPTAGFFGSWIFAFWAGEIAQMFSGDLLTYWRVLPIYFWVLAIAVRESRPPARQ